MSNTATTTTEPLTVWLENIPSFLSDQPQWVGWKLEGRDGKLTKVPYNVRTGNRASCTDRNTWSNFEAACRAYLTGDYSGIGFVLADGGGLTGVDIDRAIDPQTGAIAQAAQDIIEALDSYTETSPSGTGIRIIVRGTPPTGSKNRGQLAGTKGIEIYTTARYLTITGRTWDGEQKTVEERTPQLAAIVARIFPPTEPRTTTASTSLGTGAINDDAVLEKMFSAKNGTRMRALFNGDTSGYGNDQSRANAALCTALAFWTNSCEAQIERLWMASGLRRAKTERADYRQRTIREAIRTNDGTHYEPRLNVNTAGPGRP